MADSGKTLVDAAFGEVLLQNTNYVHPHTRHAQVLVTCEKLKWMASRGARCLSAKIILAVDRCPRTRDHGGLTQVPVG